MDWVEVTTIIWVISLAVAIIAQTVRLHLMQKDLDHAHEVAHGALTAIIMHTQGADISLTRIARDGTPIRENEEE